MLDRVQMRTIRRDEMALYTPLRFRRHIDTMARHIEFLTVINASDATGLVEPEEQTDAAVRAIFIHQGQTAIAVPKSQ